jgi:SAM-dependent methyltransferase
MARIYCRLRIIVRATFVGVDGASQIDITFGRHGCSCRTSISSTQLPRDAATMLSGQFDYIIGHGVFSWVSDHARDALLRLCAKRLRHGGLLYLNYNTNPGWKVRGLVRDFLRAQTAGEGNLRVRAGSAQVAAAKVMSSLTISDHPYSKLLANEFAFVCDSDISYVAHECENHAYWRSNLASWAFTGSNLWRPQTSAITSKPCGPGATLSRRTHFWSRGRRHLIFAIASYTRRF